MEEEIKTEIETGTCPAEETCPKVDSEETLVEEETESPAEEISAE